MSVLFVAPFLHWQREDLQKIWNMSSRSRQRSQKERRVGEVGQGNATGCSCWTSQEFYMSWEQITPVSCKGQRDSFTTPSPHISKLCRTHLPPSRPFDSSALSIFSTFSIEKGGCESCLYQRWKDSYGGPSLGVVLTWCSLRWERKGDRNPITWAWMLFSFTFGLQQGVGETGTRPSQPPL